MRRLGWLPTLVGVLVNFFIGPAFADTRVALVIGNGAYVHFDHLPNPKSAAADRGFREGDEILEIAGKSVTSADDVREAINAARANNKSIILLLVKAGGQKRFVAVPFAKS
jgi:membrane-associated protease RseP (regulator of RpoE activity)